MPPHAGGGFGHRLSHRLELQAGISFLHIIILTLNQIHLKTLPNSPGSSKALDSASAWLSKDLCPRAF